MELNKLAEANPWWTHKKVSDELKGRPRTEYGLLLKSIDVPEITIITGVRRSGKSTIMYQMVDSLLNKGIPPEQILFVNLEDNKLVKDTLDDLYDAYRQNMNPEGEAYVFLDEIHKKDGWETWLRTKYDRKAKCKFVISGSNSHLLKKEYSTLLTGRNLTFEVFPLSFREFLDFKGVEINRQNIKKGLILDSEKYVIIKAFAEYLGVGGFPNVFFKDKDFRTKLLAQYFDDILYKDIIDRHNLNSQKAKDLALYLITNFTHIISLRGIRNSLGLSYKSIVDYTSYYKEAFLFFTLDHFSYSMKEQKTRPAKIYCIDNGLRNAVSFRFSKDEGKLAENLVFIELQRRAADIYYWKGNGEVDFVIKNTDQSLTAVNVSYGDKIDEREVSPLLDFKTKFKKTRELLILTKNIERKKDGITFIPLWKWLLS
ncbi:MAG: ATP-binding protein [Candidatus Micrarchaeota archaeon]